MRRHGTPALAQDNNFPRRAWLPRIGPNWRAAAASHARIAAVVVLTLAAGCGREPATVPAATAYADPGFIEVEGWRLHYALTSTPDLPAAIAGSYGIVQRPNLALLVIALEARPPLQAADATQPEVEAVAVSLAGERKALALARHDEAGRPTWLATVEVRHRVPITIEIRARATSAGPELRTRLTREFRLE